MSHARPGQGRHISEPGVVHGSLVVAGCALVFAAYAIAPTSTWPERKASGTTAGLEGGKRGDATRSALIPPAVGVLDEAGAERIRRMERERQKPAGTVGTEPARAAAVPAAAVPAGRPRPVAGGPAGSQPLPEAAPPRAEPGAARKDPRAWSRPNADAPLQTGWIPVDEGQPLPEPKLPAAREGAEHAAPAAEPAIDKPPIVSFAGLDFVEQTGNPAVSAEGGNLAFTQAGSGLVYAALPDSGYTLGFDARTEAGWQFAVDANPHAKAAGERPGTVIEYRVGGAPGLYATRAGKKLFSAAAFDVDLDWHSVKAILTRGSLALYLDRKQVLLLNRSRATRWVGLGGAGEFKDVSVK